MYAAPRISLHLIRGFSLAARHLSFTKAAAELFVTQSAVSREIKKLEEQLGQPLFSRTNRTLQLTQAGEELYRAVDEALVLIDVAANRIARTERSLNVTTTVPLASLWLVPRLPRFTRQHADIDVRIAANNEWIDLSQAHMDVAIRFAGSGGACAYGKRLVTYSLFPVCAPMLMTDPARPLRTVADLANHVLLEFETTTHGRPWYDWDQWFKAMKIGKFKPAGRQQFSHYDQVVEAVLAGCGVAIGKRPHLNSKLSDGTLCAPFGPEWTATLGSFYLVVAESAIGDSAVDAFVAWLRDEIRCDGRRVAKRQGSKAEHDTATK